MKLQNVLFASLIVLFSACPAAGQERNYDPVPMNIDVGNIQMTLNMINGEGGLQTEYSWMLTGTNPASTEIFYWPWDEYQSNLLYQIFNPLVLDGNGIIDQYGNRAVMFVGGGGNDALINSGRTDWAIEVRRYRPPVVTVDGIRLTPPYQWYVDPTLKSDLKIEFEDVLNQFGIRSHVKIYAFSNPNHADYFIWKATHKFTGELKVPREAASPLDTLPDQTIRFWWPIAFSFGPSKAGEREALGTFAFEGEDDLDSWFRRPSGLVSGTGRDSLYVAYYYDWDSPSSQVYANGSTDDVGDPDRATGRLCSPQIAGYALLHADRSASDHSDDATQPYAMPHATITGDLWGRRDPGLLQTYRGDDARGRFPLDPITAGLATAPEKGPMRFITCGPYQLTKNSGTGQYDSVSFAYAVGMGSIGPEAADSIGRLWFNGQITDQEKRDFIMKGRDSLWTTMDRANWAWNRMEQDLPIPSPPPPPDVSVTSGPDRITVEWSYPDPSYYLDPATGVDDWAQWRVYRKRGAFLVYDPLDEGSGEKWEVVYQTTNRSQTSYVDTAVQRGVDYYYAVTAVDNGTQNTFGLYPGQQLEGSRFVNRSQVPASSFKPGLNESGKVLVVPNPATVAAGALNFAGSPGRVLFVNLPVKCTIRIYTETGDLVKTIEHYGTADYQWDQRTDENQYVASGIYILAITDAEDINGKPLDNQFEKFVLVR